jgi:hypothetical protein
MLFFQIKVLIEKTHGFVSKCMCQIFMFLSWTSEEKKSSNRWTLTALLSFIIELSDTSNSEWTIE